MKRNILLSLAAGTLLSACGGGHHDSPPPTTIEGRAVKGVLQEAIVTAYRLDEKGTRAQTLATTRTDVEGNYKLFLSGASNEPVLVALTVDDKTTMICENTDGCAVSDSEVVEFGKPVPAPATLELQALLPNIKGNKGNSANITVFSDLAATLGQDYVVQNKPMDTLNAAQVNSKMSDLLQQYSLLGIGDQALNIKPVDVSDESEVLAAIENGQASELKLAFISAAFNEVARQDYQNNIVDALEGLRGVYVANRGELPKRKSANTKEVSIGSLLEETHRQIEKISAKYAEKNVSFAAISTDVMSELDQLKLPATPEPAAPAPATPEPTTPAPATPVPVDPEPVKPQPPKNGDDSDDENKTKTQTDNALESYLVNNLLAGKELLQSVRTFGYELKTNANSVMNDIVADMGGKVDVTATKESFIEFVDQSKTIYPHIGNIMVAMLRWMENEGVTGSYDLAQDPDNLLPDGMKITGVVTKTYPYWWSTNPTLKLSNGFVEGVGTVDFEISAYGYSYCYYCSTNERGTMKLSVKNPNVTVAITSSSLEVTRYYNWTSRTRTPSSAWIRDARISTTFGYPAKSTTTVKGTADIGLRWQWGEPQQIPVITNFSLSSSNYQYGSEKAIQYFSGRLAYYNNDSYWSPTSNPVEWAKHQATDFSIDMSFDATIRVPNPNNPYSSTYKTAGIDISFANDTYNYSSGNYWDTYTMRSVAISYDGESFSLSRYSKNDYDDRYRFANKAGAIMELLVSKDGKALREGKIEYDGKVVASIESTQTGPIIRFTDGSFESF